MVTRKQDISREPARNAETKLPRGIMKAWHLAVSLFLHTKSRSGNWPEWVSLALVFLTLAIAVYSVEEAMWISPQPSLILTLLLAILTTLVAAKSRLPNMTKHAIILLLGIIITVWQLSSILAPQPWWQALEIRPNEGTTYFAVFLILVTWMIGYISTWFMLERRNTWITVFMGTIMILVNLNNLPKDYDYFFPIYILAAVLLIGQTNLAKQISQLKQYGRNYSRHGIIYHISVIISLSVLISSSTSFLPEIQLDQDLAISNRISWENSKEHWLNIFATVAGKKGILTRNVQGDEQGNGQGNGQDNTVQGETVLLSSDRLGVLLFSNPLSQEEGTQFMISSNNTVGYWFTRRYDTYLPWGWTSNNRVNSIFYPGEANSTDKFLQRRELTYTITNKVQTDILLTTGEFKTSNLPVLLQTVGHQPITTQAQTQDRVKDVVSIIAPQVLPLDEAYTITVRLTQATPTALFQASTDYDQWVTEYYLQLPESLPERVKELSQKLTEGAGTPYEKVLAIKNFLLEGQLRYSRDDNTPPQGIDAVDYFLFDKKEGDCTYFASAMAVMLRSVGVPARVSSGYRVVEQDRSNDQFILRAQDYHNRAEVYFPEYGWIEFETTPGLFSAEEVGLGIPPEILALLPRPEGNLDSPNTGNLSRPETPVLADEYGEPFFAIELEEFGDPALAVNPEPIAAPGTPIAEPIPAIEPESIAAPIPPAASIPALEPESAAVPTPAATPTPTTTPEESFETTPGIMSVWNRNPYLPLISLLSLIILTIGIAGILFYKHWLNQVRQTGEASGIYAKMCVLASLGQSGPKPIETPLEYSARLALVVPTQSQTIDNITQIYTESRFSRQKDLDQTKRKKLEKSWAQLYPTLIRRILRH
ncbi:MAG: transglutaminase domain-containing protein [Dehalococcoidales bacterium]|nr:transglutaminase domain-containing protein [Dehalococcoidales bacterium]MDP6737697.1 transglutaminase domain-containing protein [Dehalococcoidales bacterium]